MFKVGDRVKYVGCSKHPEYRNLSVGVVTIVGEGNSWPVNVVFEGFDYGPTNNYLTPFHPCGYDELELVK
jgi:hypothetical protein